MTKIKVLLAILAIGFCWPVNMWAQASGEVTPIAQNTTVGTEFWLAFMNNNAATVDKDNATLELKVVCTSTEELDVLVESGNGAAVGTIHVPAGGKGELVVPQGLYLEEMGQYNYGIRVYAQDRKTPFSCFAYNRVGATDGSSRDASLVLPVTALGEQYMIQTFPKETNGSEFVVIATENNTIVNINIEGTPAQGVTSPTTLNRGDVYFITSQKPASDVVIDLTGTTVCANKPVAVFVGNQTSPVPQVLNGDQGDHLYEQLLPISNLGTKFYLAMPEKINVMAFVPTAVQDGTDVTISRGTGTTNKTLNSGDSYFQVDASQTVLQIRPTDPTCVVTTSQPTIMYQFLSSASFNQIERDYVYYRYGDAASAMVPAWEQRVTETTFFTQEIDLTDETLNEQYHYVQITTRTADVGKLSIVDEDGNMVTIPAGAFKKYAADPAMSYANISLEPDNAYTIKSSGEGFVGIVYGLTDDGQSYMYTLGLNPFLSRDSLFVRAEDVHMLSYNLDTVHNEFYARQLEEWPIGQERLDTAIVCDGSTVNFETLLGSLTDVFTWEVWQTDNRHRPTKRVAQSIVSPVTDMSQKFVHKFVLPSKDVLPVPYVDYEIDGLIDRGKLLCPDMETDPDTLRMMVRVTRVYEDTVQLMLCAGESLRFFHDSLPNQKNLSVMAGHADSTTFYGYKKGLTPPATGAFEVAAPSGETLFYTRHYLTTFGCDSLMTLQLYVCDTVHKRVPDMALTPTNNYKITFPVKPNTMFSGQTISAPGVYRDTLHTVNCPACAGFENDGFEGCDSIVELHVVYRDTIYNTFCDSVYHYDTRTKTLNSEHFYEQTLEKTRTVATSETVYYVEQDKTIRFDEIQHYAIMAYPASATFVESHITSAGVDSGIVFILTAEPLRIEVQNVTITPTDEYTWYPLNPDQSVSRTYRSYIDSIGAGKPYPEGTKTIYYHYTKPHTELECGKIIYRLDLTLGFRKDTIIDVCDIDSVHWRGRVIVSKKFLEDNPLAPGEYDVCYNCTGAWSIAPCKTRLWPTGTKMYDDTVHGNPDLGQLDSIYGLKLRVSPTYLGNSKINDVQHICASDVYVFGNQTKHGWEQEINGENYRNELEANTPNGNQNYIIKTFEHTFPTVCSPENHSACDSAVHLDLYIWRDYTVQDTIYLCWDSIADKNASYYPEYPFESHVQTYSDLYKNGADFIETGQTRDPSRKDDKGILHQCDSTVHAHVYVGIKSHIDSVRHTPDTKKVTWQGRSYGPWPMGTDTIIRDTVSYPGVWKGRYPTDAGGNSLLPKTLGCDSVHYLELHVHPTYRIQRTDGVCQDTTAGAYYQWQGHGSNNLYVFGTTGRVRADQIPIKKVTTITLIDSLHTKDCEDCHITGLSCDSVEVLNLTVHPLFPHKTEKDTACQKAAYWWDKHQMQYMGDPSATPFFDEDGDAVTISTEEYSTDAEPFYTYVDRLTSIHGCDSSYTLQLFVAPSYVPETHIITIDSAFCYNDVKDGYLWVDTVVKTVGIHHMRRTLKTTECGCDSVVDYTLTVFNDLNLAHRDTVCTNRTMKVYEHHAPFDPTAAGVKVNDWNKDVVEISNTSASGDACTYFDSLIVYVRQASPDLHLYDTACSAANGMYTWSHYIKDVLPATRGVDRMVWDVLNHRRIKANEIPLSLVGNYTYVDSMQTSTCGCDSIWTLYLRVNPSYSIPETRTMSDEATIKWEHTIYVGPYVNQDTLSANWFAPEWTQGMPETDKPKIVVIDNSKTNEYSVTYETKANAFACDSIRTLSIRVGKVFRDTTWDYVCDQCEYTWKIVNPVTKEETIVPLGGPQPAVGQTNDYYLKLKTSLGFDSIYVLRLTTVPSYHDFVANDEICQGATNSANGTDPYYIWDGHDLPTSNLYRDGQSITNIHTREYGTVVVVDSLKTRTLFYDPKTKTSRPTACDSIWTLTLTVKPTYNDIYNKEEVTKHDVLCSNETYLYLRTLFVGYDYDLDAAPLAPTTAQYDSVVYIEKDKLDGSIFKWHHEDPASDQDCERNLFLELTMSPRGFHYYTHSIGDNDSTWTFGGEAGHNGSVVHARDFTLRHPEDYSTFRLPYDTLLIDSSRVDGCDFIEQCLLTVYPTYRFVFDTAVCSNSEWTWRKYPAINYKPSGTYYDHLYTKAGFDSLYVLNMEVVPSFTKEYHMNICKNDTISWEKYKIFYQPGDDDPNLTVEYYARYQTSGMCDSVYHMLASFYDYYPHQVDYDTVCQYDNYHWIDEATGRKHIQQLRDIQGNHLSAVPTDTTYEIVIYDSLRTEICHCDSVYELHLFVKPSHRFYDDGYVMCSTDTFTWRGNTYTSAEAGYIRDTVGHMNEFGCDSTYFLEVKVNQAYYFDLKDTICSSQMPYVWPQHSPVTAPLEEALTWTTEHNFVLWDSLTTVGGGCDSIYHMELVVLPVLRTFLEDSICTGDTLLHVGHQLYASGTYVDTIQSSFGCDSIVTLSLYVFPPTEIKTGQPSVCANETSFDVPFSYKGLSLISYFVTYDSLAGTQDFDTVPMVVLTEKDSLLTIPLPEPKNGMYIEPNNYNGVIHFDNGVCINPDPLTIPFVLEVRYPAESVVEQHWNDFIGILVPELNGGYSFSAYQWYQNGEKLVGETGPYLYQPHYLDANSIYTVALTREGDSIAYMTCPFVPVIDRDDQLMPTMPYVSVVPNHVVKENPIVNILAVNPGTYRIYSAYGKLIDSGTFTPDEHYAMEVELPAVSGVYVFELNEQSGLVRSVKVIVY